MKMKKKSILSLLLLLVMVCTYAAVPNRSMAYANSKEQAVQSEPSNEEVVLFEGSATSSDWGQAVTLYSGSDFSKGDLTPQAQIAVTYEGLKAPVLSLQSWTHNDIWQNVFPSYTSDGVAYFSVSDMISAYEMAYGEGYSSHFQDLDAIYVSDAGADLVVTKVTITRKTIESNYYNQGDITKVTIKAFAQNTTNDWTWMSMDNMVNLVYQTNTVLNATNTSNVFSKVNSSANFGLQVSDDKLIAGEGSRLKFHIGTVIVKAEGYDDLVIDLNKEYNESYLAETVSWGLTGNNTMIILNNYLPTDEAEKTDYIHNITEVICDITLTDYEFIPAEVEGPEFPDDYTYPTTMRDISAMELVKELKVGWNLGNSLEANGGETNWGNPVTKRKMIDAIKSAGFSTLRIPVRWDEHYIDDNYTIDPEYLKRVETVVNYALINDMYAIINIHHNQLQTQANEKSKEKVLAELEAVWTQIANYFKDYGDKLIFEVLNEPRNGDDWVGNTSLYEIVNEYNAKALSAIRKTGGNNEKRLVMLPTYAALADYSKIIAMKVPDDEHVAVSLHAYTPYDFALNTAAGSQTTFGENDKKILDKLFKLIYETFVEKGIPVVLGEFAATNKDNLEDRVEYAYYYAQAAAHYEIPICWWDNGVFDTIGESLGIFNRRTLTFVYPEILQALMEGWSSEKEITDQDPDVLFSGTGTSSNWGQAVALQLGLDFVFEDFIEGLIIAAEYQSENPPELILQGQTEGVYWVKINPNKIETKDTTNIAYFTLSDMVEAYKNALADYDSYDTIFPTLASIYIGDTGVDLTVTKVYKTYINNFTLPSVELSTNNYYNTVSQTYTISSEQGDIDLSKLKIVYSAKGMSTAKHNVWCCYADLIEDNPFRYSQITDSINCHIDNAKLTITFDDSIICPENTGKVTLIIQFAKSDWSYYDTLSDPSLEIYYNGTLVK